MVIEDVSGLIGISGGSNDARPAFGSDVLRIEVRGPFGLHPSTVDVLRLISDLNEEQTDDDVQTAHSLCSWLYF